MRYVPRLLLLGVVTLAMNDGGAAIDAASSNQPAPPARQSQDPARTTTLTAALRTRILGSMRLNRQTFQEKAVLDRYGERRPPASHPALVACELPRTADGGPAAPYPSAAARAT